MNSFLNPNLSRSHSRCKEATTATLVTGTGLSFLFFLSSFLLLALSAQPAAAGGSFYYDLAGGVSKFQQTSPFFGSTTQSSTGLGYALNNGVFVNWGNEHQAFAFQLGIQHRLSSASDSTASYAVQAAYPVMRFQFSRIYIGTGYTPFVWKRSNALGGVDNFSSSKSTSAFLAEAGILLPVTPKFSLGTQASAQFMTTGGAKSPNPIMDATVSMRFYFGFFGHGGASSQSSGEFKGWRYPFGMIR